MRVHYPTHVYYVLDYGKLKERESGYANAISVPAEELYVEEKETVLPLKRAADVALASFSDAALEDSTPLDIRFQMLPPKGSEKK